MSECDDRLNRERSGEEVGISFTAGTTIRLSVQRGKLNGRDSGIQWRILLGHRFRRTAIARRNIIGVVCNELWVPAAVLRQGNDAPARLDDIISTPNPVS